MVSTCRVQFFFDATCNLSRCIGHANPVMADDSIDTLLLCICNARQNKRALVKTPKSQKAKETSEELGAPKRAAPRYFWLFAIVVMFPPKGSWDGCVMIWFTFVAPRWFIEGVSCGSIPHQMKPKTVDGVRLPRLCALQPNELHQAPRGGLLRHPTHPRNIGTNHSPTTLWGSGLCLCLALKISS